MASSLQRVVLLACGSYNPVTNIHLRMFELARDALHKTKRFQVVGGLLSPVSDGYKKAGLVPSEKRVQMLKLALGIAQETPASTPSSSWIHVDTWECEQSQWTLTRVVLDQLEARIDRIVEAEKRGSAGQPESKKRKKVGDSVGSTELVDDWLSHRLSAGTAPEMLGSKVRLILLCGADVLETFAVPNLWSPADMQKIVSHYGMAVITRPNSDPSKFIYESDLLTEHNSNIFVVREWLTNDVSSTKVRRAFKRGDSNKYLVHDDVIDYVYRHRLYGCHDKPPTTSVAGLDGHSKPFPVPGPHSESNSHSVPPTKRHTNEMGCQVNLNNSLPPSQSTTSSGFYDICDDSRMTLSLHSTNNSLSFEDQNSSIGSAANHRMVSSACSFSTSQPPDQSSSVHSTNCQLFNGNRSSSKTIRNRHSLTRHDRLYSNSYHMSIDSPAKVTGQAIDELVDQPDDSPSAHPDNVSCPPSPIRLGVYFPPSPVRTISRAVQTRLSSVPVMLNATALLGTRAASKSDLDKVNESCRDRQLDPEISAHLVQLIKECRRCGNTTNRFMIVEQQNAESRRANGPTKYTNAEDRRAETVCDVNKNGRSSEIGSGGVGTKFHRSCVTNNIQRSSPVVFNGNLSEV